MMIFRGETPPLEHNGGRKPRTTPKRVYFISLCPLIYHSLE